MNILLLACVVYAGTIDEYRVSSLTLTFQPFFKEHIPQLSLAATGQAELRVRALVN